MAAHLTLPRRVAGRLRQMHEESLVGLVVIVVRDCHLDLFARLLGPEGERALHGRVVVVLHRRRPVFCRLLDRHLPPRFHPRPNPCASCERSAEERGLADTGRDTG